MKSRDGLSGRLLAWTESEDVGPEIAAQENDLRAKIAKGAK